MIEVLVHEIGALEGVQSVNYVTSNQDQSLPFWSIKLIVNGGNVSEIAEKIHFHKIAGLATVGDTAVMVQDDLFGGFSQINFDYTRSEVVLMDLPMHKPQPEYIETNPAFVCGPEHEAVNNWRVLEIE